MYYYNMYYNILVCITITYLLLRGGTPPEDGRPAPAASPRLSNQAYNCNNNNNNNSSSSNII